ncbi:MAG: hypothetical protein HYT72_02120 [Candidatus Aenigmarchaeota archaeon]|nr:hypothetical protein [Candidatus Aenigmarchaeota archaeon]
MAMPFSMRSRKYKRGIIEPLTAGALTMLMIGVAITVFVWGEPFLRKSEAVSVLESSEKFMNGLADKIKEVVNDQSRTRASVELPQSPSPAIKMTMSFDSVSKILLLEISGTSGTIYSPGGFIALGRNACTPNEGIAYQDEPQTVCVSSDKTGDNYVTTYTLKFIQLNTEGTQSSKIDLTGDSKSASSGSILLENKGTKTDSINGKEVKKFRVALDLVK